MTFTPKMDISRITFIIWIRSLTKCVSPLAQFSFAQSVIAAILVW